MWARQNRREFVKNILYSSGSVSAAITRPTKHRLGIRILEADAQFLRRPFRQPLQLSSGIISEITEIRTKVWLRAGGREAVGRGSIYLSVLWAWPRSEFSVEERDRELQIYCRQIARRLPSLVGEDTEHPLELGLRLHKAVSSDRVEAPILARLLCASPFDAAIHDGAGIALQRSAFGFYTDDYPVESADQYFPRLGSCRAIHGVMCKPRVTLPAWWVIGPADLHRKDFAEEIRKGGYQSFKLKISGRNVADDAAHTIEVFERLREVGIESPRLTIDSNEGNLDTAAVAEFLERIQSAHRATFDAIMYLEQPTSREIARYRVDWRHVTKLKPVLMDEALVSMDLFELAVQQGWSGFALKTAKGHSFSLVSAAWAHRHGLGFSLQDLTNPGLAAIHAALMAAYLPTINGVELNSPQFTPEANLEWLPRLNSLFEPQGGLHRVPVRGSLGLGSLL